MLTVSHIRNQKNINFMSSQKSIGDRMIESYNKCKDPFREMLIRRNKENYIHEIRGETLVIAAVVALIVAWFVCPSNTNNNVVRKVDVKETEVLQKREKELDKSYKEGTLLFEEYVNELNKVKSDYAVLEAETANKLDNVVQSRIEHSDLKSMYNTNPSAGKYDYDLSVDYGTKTAKINVLDGSKN